MIRREIEQRIADVGGGPVTTDFVHDAPGNLVFDGQFWYQYDAWNRPIQINDAGTLTAEAFSPSGRLDPNGVVAPDPNDPNAPTVWPGELRERFAYDGPGRLIHRETPISWDRLRVADYYYDGVRRIQEATLQPPEPIGMLLFNPEGGEPDLIWSELEFVWGPDYVDELALLITKAGNPRYPLQDANYNLVGLARPNGVVAAQYVYGPYGEVRAADWINPLVPAPFAVGHQGLFFVRFVRFVRFDAETDAPPLEPGAAGLCYNRNRWYSPHLGRFLQRDVNETALPIIVALPFNGQTLEGLLKTFDVQGLYADGMNLYAYLGSNPVNGLDALGLYDPFEDVDAWIEDRIGNALYTLGQVNEALLGLHTALSVASALLGVDVFADVVVLASGRGGFWEAMNIVAAMTPVGRLGKVGGVIGKMFKWSRRGARGGDAALGAFRAFTRGNFRHNLRVLTRFDAPKNIHAHHMLPIRHERRFSKAGVNIHDPRYGAWWEEHSHLTNRVRYDGAWDAFFKEYPNPSPAQIESQARQLAERFGLPTNF